MKRYINHLASIPVVMVFIANTTVAQASPTTDLLEAFEGVSETIEKIDAYEKSKTLQTISNSLKSLSDLAPFIGILGASVDIINEIAGAKSEDEITIEMLEELSKDVAQIEKKLGYYYIRDGNRMEYNAIRTNISENLSDIESMRKDWITMQSPSSSIKARQKSKKDFDNRATNINEWAQRIHDMCVKTTPAHFNLFQTLDKHSFGDEILITEWGKLVIVTMTNLAMFESYAIHQQPGNDMTAEHASYLMNAGIESMNNDVLPMLTDCVESYQDTLTSIRKTENISKNAKEFIEAEFSDYQVFSSASSYASKLQQKYPHRDWLFVKYEPVGGYGNHYVSGRNYTTWFRKVVGDQKLNVVMHHYPITPNVNSGDFGLFAIKGVNIVLFDCIVLPCKFSWGDYKKYLGEPGPYPFLWSSHKEDSKKGKAETPSNHIFNDTLEKISTIDMRVHLNQMERGPFLMVGRTQETKEPEIGSTNDLSFFKANGPKLWAINSH